MLTLLRFQCSSIPTPLDLPGASIMTACVRAATVYALSVAVARVASLASFAGFTIQADIANQTHRAHAAWLATDARSACHADQADCARLALIAQDSRSAKFASSANRANPATGRVTATADDLQGRRVRHRLGLPRHHLSVFHQPAVFSPSDKRTGITPLVTAFTTSRTGIVHPNPHTVASLISSRSNVPKK